MKNKFTNQELDAINAMSDFVNNHLDYFQTYLQYRGLRYSSNKINKEMLDSLRKKCSDIINNVTEDESVEICIKPNSIHDLIDLADSSKCVEIYEIEPYRISIKFFNEDWEDFANTQIATETIKQREAKTPT